MSPLAWSNVILPVNDGFVIVGVLIVGDVNVLFVNVSYLLLYEKKNKTYWK